MIKTALIKDMKHNKKIGLLILKTLMVLTFFLVFYRCTIPSKTEIQNAHQLEDEIIKESVHLFGDNDTLLLILSKTYGICGNDLSLNPSFIQQVNANFRERKHKIKEVKENPFYFDLKNIASNHSIDINEKSIIPGEVINSKFFGANNLEIELNAPSSIHNKSIYEVSLVKTQEDSVVLDIIDFNFSDDTEAGKKRIKFFKKNSKWEKA